MDLDQPKSQHFRANEDGPAEHFQPSADILCEPVFQQSNSVNVPDFDRLPPETVSEIFILCTDNLVGITTPWRLGAVCQRWREIAWTTPQIWTTLSLSLRSNPEQVTRIQLAVEWLRRARTLPLSIVFDASGLDQAAIPHLHHFMDVVNSLANQWYYLRLCMPTRVLARLDDAAASESRCLRELHLEPSDTDYRYSGTLAHVTPRVVHIPSDDVYPLRMKWDSVVELTAGLNMSKLLQILNSSPHLRNCEAIIKDGWNQPSLHVRKQVLHPTVQYLNLRLTLNVLGEPILDYISFPALEHLCVFGIDIHNRPNYDNFLPFLMRCTKGLKRLKLEVLNWDGEDLTNIFRSTPSLEALDISILPKLEKNFEPFYQALAGRAPEHENSLSGQTGLVLPMLREFKWSSWQSFPWDVLVKFLAPVSQGRSARQALSLIEIYANIDIAEDPIPYVSKEVLSQLSAFTDQVKFRFRIPTSSWDPQDPAGDLWKLSLEKHLGDEDE